MTDPSDTTRTSSAPDDTDVLERERIYLLLTLIIQVVLLAGVVGFVLLRDWPNALLTTLVIVLTAAPAAARRVVPRRRAARVPARRGRSSCSARSSSARRSASTDGSTGGTRPCTPPAAACSGIVGFIAVFLINGTDHRPEGMRISLIAIFGFMFAVTLGVFWEIYEFVADNLIPGLNMQVVETGTTDTMIDMIVNTIGAAVVALLGYLYSRSGRESFIVDGVWEFVRRNPHLFSRAGHLPDRLERSARRIRIHRC